MAEPYLTLLAQIVDRLGPLQVGSAKLESKHFFSGAALYANGKIIASLSPAGFAIKLPADRRRSLIEEGKGTEFRFFPNGQVSTLHKDWNGCLEGNSHKFSKRSSS